ncbi:MAG: tetratricopeptide repeat protein [Isosphaeraceae bacterium]
METRDSDRNLLFGILALQLDFIDRDQLIAGMNAWVLDKRSPLGRILMDHGALSPANRALLEPLVDAHLQNHGGDAGKSLAALSGSSSAREALAGIRDTEVQDSLASIGAGTLTGSLGPHDRTTVWSADGRTTTMSAGTTASSGARFRVLRPHARGGLGAVFVAIDEELHREVALKQILDERADDPTSRQRFLIEAEVTGGLEHPGIVPVYGLGSYEDGRPFYAMRFIKGDSLKEAIAAFHADASLKSDPGRRSLELRKLLRRFTDVCNAIEYAHSRGVLHRDLKPGNVIVGRYGETLVVDWGLAKATGRRDPDASLGERTLNPASSGGGAETLPGQALGTPAYMSPEQAAGELEKLGAPSDVYSLGATLYCLLTGNAPFEGNDVFEVLQKVQRGDFPRPRLFEPSIDKAIESVCLKAMALEPADRYSTCCALAEDVERWLADEPVGAYREPFARRAGRMVRRHRTAVTAAALAGLVLVGALGVGYWRESAYSANLLKLNTNLEVQRRRAEGRERDAIAAVKRFGEVISQNPVLKNRLELESLRKELLKEPLSFFKSLRGRLLQDSETRPENLARLGVACFELGRLADEIGDKQDALIAHREGQAIRQKLIDANPSVIHSQIDLARSHNYIGTLLSQTGRPDEAIKAHEAARAIRQRLVDADPAASGLQLDLAESYYNIAAPLRETGRLDEAMKACEAARAIQQRLADADPTATESQFELARSHDSIGGILHETGRLDEAMKAYESALRIQQRLADANPTATESQFDLALSHIRIGALLSDTGHPGEAMRAYEAARAIQQRLADANPTATRFQLDLATSHNNIGALLSDTGHPGEAMKAYESALGIQQRLADANPAVTEFQLDLARSQGSIGELLDKASRPGEAMKAYESARAIQQRLADANPAVTEFQLQLAATYSNIGSLLRATGRPEEAVRAHTAGRAIRQKLADANPTVTEFQLALARSHYNIGNLLVATGHPKEAMKAYEAARAIQQELAQKRSSLPELASDLGGTLHNMATIDLDNRRFDEAQARLREAIRWQKQALGTNLKNPEYRQRLINHLTMLPTALSALGRIEEKAEVERELAEMHASDPRFAALDARLAAVISGAVANDQGERLALAQRAYDTNRHATAVRLWNEALKSDPALARDRDAQYAYSAACSAVLAATGRGKDNPSLDDTAKVRYRQQAQAWLEAELAAWSGLAHPDHGEALRKIPMTLRHWQQDTDLAAVRDRDALEALPERERQQWQAFWAEVERVRRRSETGRDLEPPAHDAELPNDPFAR